MSEKKVNARVLNKHDTRTNWDKATGFIPKPGEIIIYDKDLENGDDSSYPKFKVGNGIDSVIDLSFAAGDLPMEKGAGIDAVQQKGCTASGDYSFASGEGTRAKTEHQTTIGKWNADDNDALFIVGNGTADNARSNLFSVGTDTDGNYVKIGDKKVATKDDIPNLNGVEFKENEMDFPLETRNGAYGEEAIPYNINAQSGISINTFHHANGDLSEENRKDRQIISYTDYDFMNPDTDDTLVIGTEPAGPADMESTAINEVHIKGKNIILTPEFQIVDAGYFYEASPAMEITGTTTEPVINTHGKLYHNGEEVATKDDIFDIVRANSDAIVGHGISYIVASGTANAVSPAYTETVLASGITLKKGKGYRFNVSVDRGTTTAKTVWVSLKDSGNNQLKQLTLSTSVDNSFLDFNLTTDYSDAYISFKTEVTSGYTVSANLELTAESGSERYSPNTEFIADDFVNGDATFWNGGATINYGATYRVTCTLGTMYKYAQDVHIKAADGFKFVIGYYNDGACTSESGWQSEITVPANQQFRIMIQRATPNTSEVADVAEFVSKLRIYTNGLKEIYDLVNENNTQEETTSIAENSCVKPFEVLSINHRGYNRVAPENTLAAYRLSKKNGFDFVECDVRFTSDGVPVLLHDESINRTARNADGSEISSTINIADITYETALTYDFGIWKGEEYAGTKIPTLAEFMQLCRALSIYPYLDLYVASSATHAQAICDVIKSCGMEHNVTFMSPFPAVWDSMSNVMPEARYGLISWEADPATGTNIADYIDTLRAKGVKNIFAMGDRSIMNTSLFIAMCKEKGVSLETYSPNTEEEILALDPFISGIISDTLVAKDVLRYANDEAQIKVGSTTITETQLQNLLSLLNNIYDGSVSFLITFKIDDVEYQAEEGMTWGEWCDSEYNPDDYYYISTALNNQVCAEGLIPVFADDTYEIGTEVYEDNPIIENHKYYT